MRVLPGILIGILIVAMGAASAVLASPSRDQGSAASRLAQATPQVGTDPSASRQIVARETIEPIAAQSVEANYTITKSVSGDTVYQDGDVTYVENGNVTYTVTVSGTLPAGVSLNVDDSWNGPAELVDPGRVLVTCIDGSSCGNLTSDTNDVSFDISRTTDGPINTVLTYDVQVDGEPLDNVQNLACATSPGLFAQCAGVGLTIPLTAPPMTPTAIPTAPPTEAPAAYTIAKSAGRDTVGPGGTISYTVSITGTLAPDQVIEVSDLLPGDTDLVADSISLGCSIGQCSQPVIEPGKILFNLGNPDGGQVQAVLFYEIVVRGDIEIGSLLVNAACGNEPDVPQRCVQVTVEVVRLPGGSRPTMPATTPATTTPAIGSPVTPTVASTMVATAVGTELAAGHATDAPSLVVGLPATGTGEEPGTPPLVSGLLTLILFTGALVGMSRARITG